MPLPDALPPPSRVNIGAEPIQGLDLLGLRLPVQAIGNFLLNGVTTVTPSVRYLSLQAWIVFSYASARLPDNWTAFRTFASRVEAAVALGNLLVDPKIVGAIGVDKARRALEEEGSSVALQEMVSQLAVSTYAGPSEQLGITFARDSGIPGLTRERGMPLAEMIKGTVAETSLGPRCSQGETLVRASRAELRELGGALFLRDIPDREADLLTEILMPSAPAPKDLPRIRTYAILLALADRLRRRPREEDVFDEARSPERHLDPLLHQTLDGWLRYSVRDVIAASHEAVLREIVDAVRSLSPEAGRPVRAEDAIGMMLAEHDAQRQVLRDLDLLEPDEDPLQWKFEDLRERLDQRTSEQEISGGLARWRHPIGELEVAQLALTSGSGALALLAVAWLLASRRTEPWVSTSSEPFDIRADLGWSRIGLFDVIEPAIRRFRRERLSLLSVMAELAYSTVTQHLQIAWSRMAVDPEHDVATLISDGHLWWHRNRGVAAGRTASRLLQAIGWIEQLRLIGPEGLTRRGGRILDRTLATLAAAKVHR